jgi:hypothetical protein
MDCIKSRVEDLIGKRVCIRATEKVGSGSLLNGLTAIVVSRHPIAFDWFKIELDPNNVTSQRNWSIPGNKKLAAVNSRV